MSESDDHRLLAEFARADSEPAFAAIVARYLNLVFSTAFRCTGNAHHAEEITQAVFIILACKADKLSPRVVLSGWLYQTARLTAANFVKGEIRRHRREQEAYMQSFLNEPTDAAWREIAPLLDEAMGRLGQTDRDAVVLRFFENKSAVEIGAALRMNEEAARRRVNRAMEKLRRFFLKRGVDSTAAAIGETMSASSIQAAPATLAKVVTAVAVAKGTVASASIAILVKGTLKMMTWLKLKFAVGVSTVVLLAGGVATVALSGGGTGLAEGSRSSVFQLRAVLPKAASDSEVMTNTIVDKASGRTVVETLNVQKKVLLDGSAIQSAFVATNSSIGQPVQIAIDFTLKPKAKAQFANITRENIGQRLAFIINGRVISAPRIVTQITSGEGEISGHFTVKEASRLAALISSYNSKSP